MNRPVDLRTEQITDDNGQPYPECLIIDRPDLKGMPLIFGERLLTILFWGFWFYLWLPIVSLMAWWFGFKIFYSQMVNLGGLHGFLKQIHLFTSGIGLTSGVLAVWSFYNLRRYGSYSRRNRLLPTDAKQLAIYLNTAMPKLSQIQQSNRISFSFSEDDLIDKIHLSLSKSS